MQVSWPHAGDNKDRQLLRSSDLFRREELYLLTLHFLFVAPVRPARHSVKGKKTATRTAVPQLTRPHGACNAAAEASPQRNGRYSRWAPRVFSGRWAVQVPRMRRRAAGPAGIGARFPWGGVPRLYVSVTLTGGRVACWESVSIDAARPASSRVAGRC